MDRGYEQPCLRYGLTAAIVLPQLCDVSSGFEPVLRNSISNCVRRVWPYPVTLQTVSSLSLYDPSGMRMHAMRPHNLEDASLCELNQTLHKKRLPLQPILEVICSAGRGFIAGNVSASNTCVRLLVCDIMCAPLILVSLSGMRLCSPFSRYDTYCYHQRCRVYSPALKARCSLRYTLC